MVGRADEGDACQWHASHRTTEPTGETIGPYIAGGKGRGMSILGKDAPEDQADAHGQGGQNEEHVGEGHVAKADVHAQE